MAETDDFDQLLRTKPEQEVETPEWAPRCPYPPRPSQVSGSLRVASSKFLGLFDDMAVGKTKQVIDAAHVMHERGSIDRVLVVAPASVRVVWSDRDPTFGEVAKHSWAGASVEVEEYHARSRFWFKQGDGRPLRWVVTNYEFIRREERLLPLLDRVDERTLLVLDESSAVKSHSSAQTKACWTLRRKCGYVVLLNGTPVGDTPMDLYAQAKILHPSILDCRTVTHFRARYAVMGGYVAQTKWGPRATKVLKWINLDDLQRRLAPHVLRRMRADCLDLPERMPPSTLEVRLGERAWRAYKDMRVELLAWLDSGNVSTASQAGVRVMRLSQICAGFAGGVEDEAGNKLECEEVGREKLDATLEWAAPLLASGRRVVVWCRFRAEALRLVDVASRTFDAPVRALIGGQSPEDREEALRLVSPGASLPAMVVGIERVGARGLNMAGASDALYASNEWSLQDRDQSEARLDRPGQTKRCSYTDLVAAGPRGERTVDHAILKALRQKRDVASWTVSAWRAVVAGEV